MVNVGVIGLGFMGTAHFRNHQANRKAKVVAVCDSNPKRRAGDWSDIAGNIDTGGGKVNLKGIAAYERISGILADPAVEMVDICLPTFLHKRAVLAALKAGKHVLCEKPMSLTVRDCDEMLAAARKARKLFMIAQCIRFWPEYQFIANAIRKQKYGRLVALTLRRLSPAPTWGWQNWLMNHRRSGGALLDLHVHDVDYVIGVLGAPRAVSAAGITRCSGGLDHIVTTWDYGRKNLLVSIEGAWEFDPAYPFNMAITAVCQKATIHWDMLHGPLKVLTATGREVTPKMPAGDGWSREINYFLRCVQSGERPTVSTPTESRLAVLVARAEEQSVKRGRPVAIRKGPKR
jgi:predicted dehydrogenase